MFNILSHQRYCICRLHHTRSGNKRNIYCTRPRVPPILKRGARFTQYRVRRAEFGAQQEDHLELKPAVGITMS